MTGWLYLIKNRDLYKIGITKNYNNRMRQLKPDRVIAKLYTSDFLKLERELHQRYKDFRIPQTEYFRLESKHLNEIKQRMYNIDYPININIFIFIKSFILLTFIFCLIFIFISLTINEINIVLSTTLSWMEKISFCLSFYSLCVNSGKYFCFLNELKYRFTKLIIFILFAFSFRFSIFFIN